MRSLAQLVTDMAVVAVTVEHSQYEAMEKSCEELEAEAKRVIGTYDYDWPQLADATKEERARQGFSANEPLLRTGEMRDSIQHTVEPSGREGWVGSNDEKAAWQEFGTARIPPRSFLWGAWEHKGQDLADIFADMTVKAFMSRL